MIALTGPAKEKRKSQSTVIATELVTDGKEKAVRKNPCPRRIRRLIVEPRLVVR